MTQKKILIIDDDAEMRRALQEFLERNGYSADTAKNAKEALFKLWTGRYTLAITDIVMPEMSGLSLLSIVRAIPVPVDFLVITGNDSSENREEAYRLGAKGYIVKPFEANEVLSAIDGLTSDRKEKGGL